MGFITPTSPHRKMFLHCDANFLLVQSNYLDSNKLGQLPFKKAQAEF
ncbi:hypothetical protein COO91_06528 [Nostoc flagelliforme CCNUN1]|uniref:Uncharacterized protein n=1 Tax=Nostoc flagelliforme CCNUN1 TaxID=2038116 RepID=A0A2K8SYJ1_9NOSO|nr:hypothetical protein COO91_06528 [Nostoc flagelliforme CCNUN1]